MFKKIGIIGARNNEIAIKQKDFLVKKYQFCDLTHSHKNVNDCDLIVAVGGDGLMLHLLPLGS